MKKYANISQLQTFIALLMLCVILAFMTENFMTPDNFWNVMRQISVNVCISVGMTLVILTAGIDLSVGSILTLILFPILEQDAVYDFFTDKSTFLPALGVVVVYVPLLVTYYTSATLFLVSSDATLLNLSLQSSNLWAILFSVVAFCESPSLLFYFAVVLVVAGVFVYELLGNECQNLSEKGSNRSLRKLNSSEYESIETVIIV